MESSVVVGTGKQFWRGTECSFIQNSASYLFHDYSGYVCSVATRFAWAFSVSSSGCNSFSRLLSFKDLLLSNCLSWLKFFFEVQISIREQNNSMWHICPKHSARNPVNDYSCLATSSGSNEGNEWILAEDTLLSLPASRWKMWRMQHIKQHWNDRDLMSCSMVNNDPIRDARGRRLHIYLFTARLSSGGREVVKRNEAVLSEHELDKTLVVLGLYFSAILQWNTRALQGSKHRHVPGEIDFTGHCRCLNKASGGLKPF